MGTKAQALRELEAEFDSAENRAIGRLKFDDYMARRRAIEGAPDEPSGPDKSPPKVAAAPAPVSMSILAQFGKGLADIVKDALTMRDSRTAALEARIAALEAQPKMIYRGVWSQAEQYSPGNFATHGGSVWYCRETTRDRPGSSNAWQLAVKHGSPGRDAR